MKLLLILQLFLIVYSIDKCQEYRSQKDCIQSTDSQCMVVSDNFLIFHKTVENRFSFLVFQSLCILLFYLYNIPKNSSHNQLNFFKKSSFWNQEYCEFTKNLQLGCSSFLNKMACIKQLSNSLNEKAKCIFDNVCQSVFELTSLTCDAAISKHACLDITNIDQLCFWDPLTYQCKEVSKATYQDDFEDVLYSASVCSRIESNYQTQYQRLFGYSQFNNLDCNFIHT